MRRSFFVRWVGEIAGTSQHIALEHVIYNTATFFGGLFALLGVIYSFFSGISPLSALVLFFTVVMDGVYYYLGRFKGKADVLAFPTALSMSLVPAVLWFLLGGIRGPIPYAFFPLMAISMLFIPSRNHLPYILYLFGLSILLIMLEYYFPHWVVNFPDKDSRYWALAFLLVFGAIFTGFLVWVLKSNYKREKILVQQKNEELNDFAHVVAHDMKAPLRAVQYLSKFVLDDNLEKLSDESQEMLQKVNQSADRMSKLITDILSYTQISENHKLKKEIALSDLVNDTLDDLDVPNTVHISQHNLPDSLHYNPIALGHVLSNLLSNAIKYNDKETPKIEISGKTEGQLHWISVRDNGPGISPEYHEEIFEFLKTLGVKSKNQSGSGIGLALVKKVVETNGGTVLVDSAPGKGATFSISVPISSP